MVSEHESSSVLKKDLPQQQSQLLGRTNSVGTPAIHVVVDSHFIETHRKPGQFR